jgi:cbb3-type cytochrome oxidase subunit 3
MITNIVHSILREVENVNGYGLFSFILFFAFFIGVLVWTFAQKKNHLNHMGELPLDGGECSHPSTDKIQTK